MDPTLAQQLMKRCPRPSITDPIAPLDVDTPNRLDNKYYLNLRNNRGLFNLRSDAMEQSFNG
uniref:Peroxidase 2 n=1 Tax=Solanum tuberosum TaxID=4113 RepID=M1BK66_SOLTU